MKWADGKIRCCWANPKNERYIRYHDEEWGVPVHDDRKLFEMLILHTAKNLKEVVCGMIIVGGALISAVSEGRRKNGNL